MARKVMRDAGLPIIPGTEEALTGADQARLVADEIGYPS